MYINDATCVRVGGRDRYSKRMQGSNAARCFGHNGMNGCATYALAYPYCSLLR